MGAAVGDAVTDAVLAAECMGREGEPREVVVMKGEVFAQVKPTR